MTLEIQRNRETQAEFDNADLGQWAVMAIVTFLVCVSVASVIDWFQSMRGK